jgi:hypothetical protein
VTGRRQRRFDDNGATHTELNTVYLDAGGTECIAAACASLRETLSKQEV